MRLSQDNDEVYNIKVYNHINRTVYLAKNFQIRQDNNPDPQLCQPNCYDGKNVPQKID